MQRKSSLPDIVESVANGNFQFDQSTWRDTHIMPEGQPVLPVFAGTIKGYIKYKKRPAFMFYISTCINLVALIL